MKWLKLVEVLVWATAAGFNCWLAGPTWGYAFAAAVFGANAGLGVAVAIREWVRA